MVQRDAFIADYGSTFHGTAVRAGDRIVCVVPAQARQRPEVRASMRELVRDLGGECGHCEHCPLGLAS